MRIKHCFSIALSLLWVGVVSAQVTIGSTEKPIDGALLDLKEEGKTEKGLGLPVVKLTELKPTSKSDFSRSIGGEGYWSLADHVGLMVYNIATPAYDFSECQHKGGPIGLYVWTGSEWQGLGIKDDLGGSRIDVRTLTDDGVGTITLTYKEETTTYRYSKFGDAGIWMTENLNTQYAPDGTKLKNDITIDAYKGRYLFVYPTSRKDGRMDDTEYKANYAATPVKPVGLLYDWFTATNSENCSLTTQRQVGGVTDIPDNSEVESELETSIGAKDGKIKGICPKGWHLPSEREWSELIFALHSDPDAYSSGSNYEGTEWKEGLDYYLKIYPVLKLKENVEGKDEVRDAFSNTAASGGFAVLHPGIYQPGSGLPDYGKSTSFWSSSCSGSSTARTLTGDALKTYMGRVHINRKHFLSVRCKKDN